MAGVALAGGAAARESGDAETIIVTGTKRDQSVAELDGQAVIVGADQLARTGVLNLDQLGQAVGDLTIRQRGNRAYDSLTLRGQSSVDFYNPTVQIYVDGAPQDQATFGQAIPLGLEQVEVLYGPQGTLYGRGAIGGVVNIVTRAPEEGAFQGQAVLGERTRDVAALAGFSLVGGALFGDIAAGYQDEDGEYRDAIDGSRLGDSESASGRVRLLYAPEGNSFRALLTLSRQDTRSSEEQYVLESDIPTRTAFPVASRYRLTHDSASLKLDYALGDALISSVSTYQDRDYDRVVFGIMSPEQQDTFTQEIRIASNPSDARLSYVAGLYYERTNFSVARPDFGQTAEQTLESYAAFGEATWALTDRLDLTGGARFDYHEVSSRALVPGLSVDNDADFDGFSPKLALGYQLNDATRLYALVSTGFKAGGFTRFVTPAIIDFSYQPENVVNGEIGLRTRFWAGRGDASFAAYFTQSSDYQYYVGFQPNQYLANVGDVESKGVEARFGLSPTDAWRIDATLAYNNAEFSDYDNPVNPGVDLSGNALPYAPEWTGRLAVSRLFVLPPGFGRLRAQAGATYSSRYYFDETNTAAFGQSGYTLFDASLSWEASAHWTLDLVGENIGDETYAPYGFALGPGFNTYQLAPSREWSLRFRATF